MTLRVVTLADHPDPERGQDAGAGFGVTAHRKAAYPLTQSTGLGLHDPGRASVQPVASCPCPSWRGCHRDLAGVEVISGTVAEWEEWTGMRFPDSGAYVVPGALVPVDIDRASRCPGAPSRIHPPS
jgi:hypothetical protein